MTRPTERTPSEPDDADTDLRPGDDRRRFLQVGLAAAAGAGLASVAGTDPAAAATGDELRIGLANSGSSATLLSGSRLTVNAEGIGTGALEAFNSDPAGFGVNGLSTMGAGAAGSGVGVRGVGAQADGVGVRAEASGARGTAVQAAASGAERAIAVLADAPNGVAIRIVPASTTPWPPTSKFYDAGSLVVHGANLWYCTTSGTGAASKWVNLSSAAGAFVALDTPVRAYDSRPGSPPLGGTKGPLSSGQERVIDLAGTLPAAAKIALINLTATGTSPGGFLAVYRNGIAWPGTSNLNWSAAGTSIANQATTKLDATRKMKVYCGGSGATSDVIIDVVGYYT
jgi:hypothetical protein